MIDLEKHKVLFVSTLAIGALSLSACSNMWSGTNPDNDVIVAENTKEKPILVPMGAEYKAPAQAYNAPTGGGVWVERTNYNALPETYGNSSEDISSSIPITDDSIRYVSMYDQDCEDDFRSSVSTKVSSKTNEKNVPQNGYDTSGISSTGNMDIQTESAIDLQGAEIGEIDSEQPIEDWMAPEGTSLRSLLTDWSDRTGWKVVWKSDREYILEAGAMFRGRYVDVTSALIRTFARARPAPIATFYKGNKVLLITTLEDENAD